MSLVVDMSVVTIDDTVVDRCFAWSLRQPTTPQFCRLAKTAETNNSPLKNHIGK